MGDISEIRGLVVVGTFLGVFALLTALLPYELYTAGDDRRTIDVPEYFEAIDIQNFTSTEQFTINNSLNDWCFKIGGHDVMFFIGYPLGTEIRIDHFFTWWIFQHGFHSMKWYDSSGARVSYEHSLYHELLPISVLDEHDYGEVYKLKCEHFYSSVVFGYNQTAYSSHVEAFNDEALAVFFGVGFDQMGTSYNAWDIISMVIFFQMPNVHWIINAIIAIPIWIAVSYISFILILRAIGGIFGGGGA